MAKKKISSLSVVLGATVKPFVSAFRGAQGTVSRFVSSIKSAGLSVLKFTGIGAAIGGVFAAFKGAASGISLAAQLEQNTVAFETMLGSATAAKGLMEELTAFSAGTPFQFPEIAGSAKKLLAFGVAQDQITDKLRTLGDISAGVGKPLEELAAIYGKVKSRGKLTGQTLNQLAEAGVPIYRALAQELGVAETAIAGLVTKGEIGFERVDAALSGLTAEGGQFAGLMEKQSQTLAGLWSTLTDNIGLAAAGMVTTLVDAFGLRDVLKSFTGAVGNIGGMLNNAVATWAPVVVTAMQWIWTTITGIWQRIYAFVLPIVQGIGDFISRNWQRTVTVTTGYVLAIWNVVSSVFTAIWEIVSAIGNAVVSAWNWAMDALGFKTVETGSAVGNAFEGIAEVGEWLLGKVTYALNVMAYAIGNWRDTFELAFTEVALFVVRIGEQFDHVFTQVIPGYLRWFGENWKQILMAYLNFSKAIWTNIAVNAVNALKAIWSWIKGDGFDFEWTGLIEGFEHSVSALPAIAERQIGKVESALERRADFLRGKFASGLNKHLADQERQATDAASAIIDTMKGLGEIKSPTIDTPEMPAMPTMQMEADTSGIEAIGDAAKKSADSLQALMSGSAEALKARASAAFAARVGSGTAASAPRAEAVPAGATKAMRDANEQKGLLQKQLEEEKNTNSLLAELVDLVGRKQGLSPAGF